MGKPRSSDFQAVGLVGTVTDQVNTEFTFGVLNRRVSLALRDMDLLDNVAESIMGRTICALGDAAAMPVRGMLKHFRAEFEHHITHKTCMVSVPV